MNAAQRVDEYIISEFGKQGHHLTGKWEENLKHEEISDGVIQGLAMIYGLIVNAGTPPDRIPFNDNFQGGKGVSTGGKESAYIRGLYEYWLKRKPGITEKQALRLAFATAIKQKQEGMSTIASEQYSSTGKRQGFLNSLVYLFEEYLDDWIFVGHETVINEQVKEPKKIYL